MVEMERLGRYSQLSHAEAPASGFDWKQELFQNDARKGLADDTDIPLKICSNPLLGKFHPLDGFHHGCGGEPGMPGRGSNSCSSSAADFGQHAFPCLEGLVRVLEG